MLQLWNYPCFKIRTFHTVKFMFVQRQYNERSLYCLWFVLYILSHVIYSLNVLVVFSINHLGVSLTYRPNLFINFTIPIKVKKN